MVPLAGGNKNGGPPGGGRSDTPLRPPQGGNEGRAAPLDRFSIPPRSLSLSPLDRFSIPPRSLFYPSSIAFLSFLDRFYPSSRIRFPIPPSRGARGVYWRRPLGLKSCLLQKHRAAGWSASKKARIGKFHYTDRRSCPITGTLDTRAFPD